MIGMSVADAVTQDPASRVEGREERCCNFCSEETWTTQRKVHPNLWLQLTCFTVQSLVSSCNTWETRRPKAIL